MAFCATRTPPRRPMIAQGAIPLLGGFVCRKKSDFDVLALQHLSNKGGHAHVARIKGQVQRFVARRCGLSGQAQQHQQPEQTTAHHQYRLA